jgi:hypothetical protein
MGIYVCPLRPCGQPAIPASLFLGIIHVCSCRVRAVLVRLPVSTIFAFAGPKRPPVRATPEHCPVYAADRQRTAQHSTAHAFRTATAPPQPSRRRRHHAPARECRGYFRRTRRKELQMRARARVHAASADRTCTPETLSRRWRRKHPHRERCHHQVRARTGSREADHGQRRSVGAEVRVRAAGAEHLGPTGVCTCAQESGAGEEMAARLCWRRSWYERCRCEVWSAVGVRCGGVGMSAVGVRCGGVGMSAVGVRCGAL